ncbi:hypothetical protein J4462_04430 [Candidatus Pacearchaeota archaeon]|nr:hypothetical protein [Candidatus Pacearchaeota archaeon]
MEGKKVLVLSGVLLVVASVVASAYVYVNKWTFEEVLLEEGHLSFSEKDAVARDLENAGYDVHDDKRTISELMTIANYMAVHDDEYESDWSDIKKEMDCAFEWYYEVSQPGQMIQPYSDTGLSYCIWPSGGNDFVDTDNNLNGGNNGGSEMNSGQYQMWEI